MENPKPESTKKNNVSFMNNDISKFIMEYKYLIILNLQQLITFRMKQSYISSILVALLLKIIFDIIWTKVFHMKVKQCNCTSEENIKKQYVFLYHYLNRVLDYYREMIFLNMKKELIIVFGVCLVIISLGRYLSFSFMVVLMMDLYYIFTNEKCRNVLQKFCFVVIEKVKEILEKFIPKYEEPKKEEVKIK